MLLPLFLRNDQRRLARQKRMAGSGECATIIKRLLGFPETATSTDEKQSEIDFEGVQT